MIPMRKFLQFGLLAILPLLGCSEKELDPNDPQGSFVIAKEPYDDENFEIALSRLGEFKSRFPYSKYAVEAELLIANAHYELGNFAEAAVSYEQFVKLHPKHPQVDFAMFRIGESYWADAPEEIDREQEYTHRAIDEWKKLLKERPESPYAAKAKELVGQGTRRIAESVMFVTEFWCNQEKFHACAYRAIQLADEYAEFQDLRLKALEMAITALEEVAEAKAADPESDKNLYFKTMTADEIRQRAANFKRLLADYRKEIGQKGEG